VLWTPVLRNDNKFTAQTATRYLADSRVSHFWDTWSYGKNQYHEKFGTPLQESWDLFVLYQDGVEWSAEQPNPDSWFQHRDLEIGEDYTQEKLEAAIKKLIEK